MRVWRELINRIQNIRKASDFEITDRVSVTLTPTPSVQAAVEAFGDYIATQVLATEISFADDLTGDDVVELDVDGEKILVRVKR